MIRVFSKILSMKSNQNLMEGNYNFLILSQLSQMKSKSHNLSEENSALQNPIDPYPFRVKKLAEVFTYY